MDMKPWVQEAGKTYLGSHGPFPESARTVWTFAEHFFDLEQYSSLPFTVFSFKVHFQLGSEDAIPMVTF